LAATVAYRLHSDGSDDAPYDKELAEDLHALVLTGTMDWDGVMAAAGSDTIRLIILDLASSVRRAPRAFVDDTQDPVAGHGHAVKTIQVLGLAAREDQFEYRAEKMKITAHEFRHKEPIALQRGAVTYGDSHVSLGIRNPHDYTGGQHLGQIINQGRSAFGRVYSGLQAAGFPWAPF
jgi:hypothetical protein